MKTLDDIRSDFLKAMGTIVPQHGAAWAELKKQVNLLIGTLAQEADERIEAHKERHEDFRRRVHETIERFVNGEPLDHDDSWMVEQLRTYRDKREAQLVPAQGSLPPLQIRDGSSGLEIQALMEKSYDCAEFRTKAESFQTILISPWIQFQPADLHEARAELAMTIARRAMSYDSLLKQIAHQESVIRSFHEGDDRRRDEKDEIIENWRAERQRYGLLADFSDVKWEKLETLKNN